MSPIILKNKFSEGCEKDSMSQISIKEDWTSLYYAEINPEKRQRILTEHVSNPKTADDLFREKLWVSRYGKRKPKNDAFVGHLMNLKYISESGAFDIGGKKKKLAIEIIHGLYLFEFEKRDAKQQSIIFQELKNACLKFIDVSANGRGFTSVVFGMGQLSEESVAKKIADQLSVAAYTAPRLLHMDKEFAILQKAVAETFRETYPNREHFLKK